MEILYLVTAVLLLCHPRSSAQAAAVACDALKNVVIRSLFPMMVLSRLLAHSSLSEKLCRKISGIWLWKRLKLSDSLLPSVLSGILSGLPVTAVETKKLLLEGRITAEEGAKAVALSSLPSPAFVILVASRSPAVGVLRYTALLVTAYLTASRFHSVKSPGSGELGRLRFSDSIASSTSAALSVSANIVFFSALSCCFSSVLPWARQILAVFFEMGSATALVGDSQLLMSAVVGWCGLSAVSQVKSASPSLSVTPYVVTRCVSCAVLVILYFFVEFLQNAL